MAKINDEIWTTEDGTEIAVGDMSEGHVRNALRMVLRNRRRLHAQRLELMAKDENLPMPDYDDFIPERPDNHQHLAALRRQHGNAVRVERQGVAGMEGGNVYVGDRWVGWFGGI